MIKKLKIKVIFLIMGSLLTLLTVIVTVMNLINYNSLKNEADTILSIISDGNGKFPGDGRPMSPELPYESRFFSVVLNRDGTVIKTDTTHIASVTPDEAGVLATKILSSGKTRDFFENFRYCIYTENDFVRITFLDCGRKLETLYRFLISGVIISLAACAMVFVIVTILAGRIIRPIAESHEKQKRFITDAGHEMKTPLTIINANVDILEMEYEGNECLNDIKLQTERLTTLTNDLVYLSRMDEKDNPVSMIDFPLSDLVNETITSFKAPALTQGKTFESKIQPMLSMHGDIKSMEKLITILISNALKYSPEGSVISVTLHASGKQNVLSISNETCIPVEKNKLSNVFDRFYRTDSSRNSATGGNGIGLSIAKAIAEAHNGKIHAHSEGEYNFTVTAVL